MPKLPILSAREILKILRAEGFEIVGRKGSHIRLKRKKPSPTRIVIVPDYKEIPIGTLRSIIRQSGISIEEFLSKVK